MYIYYTTKTAKIIKKVILHYITALHWHNGDSSGSSSSETTLKSLGSDRGFEMYVADVGSKTTNGRRRQPGRRQRRVGVSAPRDVRETTPPFSTSAHRRRSSCRQSVASLPWLSGRRRFLTASRMLLPRRTRRRAAPTTTRLRGGFAARLPNKTTTEPDRRRFGSGTGDGLVVMGPGKWTDESGRRTVTRRRRKEPAAVAAHRERSTFHSRFWSPFSTRFRSRRSGRLPEDRRKLRTSVRIPPRRRTD